ncbi:hypothetical protein MG293_017560 [Ovis ammon polii]|uniref:Uncharacterized protein n=1 Tax=Ovis ammon polii TaxID=230172 RepID=A0AAD4TV86_OVIAM|nr:hypothetical protein MG293_017560 [Ovis ammon polii]
MRRLLEPCWWILFLKITSSVLHYVVCFPALTEGYVGTLHENRQGSSVQAQIRRRKASGDPYWAYSGFSYCFLNIAFVQEQCGNVNIHWVSLALFTGDNDVWEWLPGAEETTDHFADFDA